MKNKLKITTALISTLILGASITGCSGKNKNSSNSSNEIQVSFWTAPQKVQYDYWTKRAEEFNAAKIKVNDKIVKLTVQQMPESPSSEAGIQNALATGSAPAISENINRGFAATLAKSDVVYPLEEESWFKDVVNSRKMEEAIKGWEIDGHQYVIPLYSNPIMWQWNMKALRALGFNEAPKTVDDLKNVIEKFRENKDGKMKELGVTHTYYRPSLLRPDQWWDRWFDFQMQYEAFTGGKPWVDGDTLVLDKAASKEVFDLFGMFGDTLLTSEVQNIWQADKVQVLATINAPWEIQLNREAGKKYGVNGDYVYGQPIVKNANDTPYGFADTKGLVLYKNSNISEEQHNGAVAFIKWLYNNENSANTDLEWLKATTMLPVRGDLVENDKFKSYLDQNPELKDLAKYIPYGIPTMASDKMADIQAALTEKGLSPYIQKTTKTSKPESIDSTPYVDDAFKAMKERGELK